LHSRKDKFSPWTKGLNSASFGLRLSLVLLWFSSQTLLPKTTLPFHIHFDGRPYNTLTLLCECVIMIDDFQIGSEISILCVLHN